MVTWVCTIEIAEDISKQIRIFHKKGYVTKPPTTEDVLKDPYTWYDILAQLRTIGKYVFIVDGIEYYSLSPILAIYGISKPTAHYRFNSSRFPDWIKHDPKEDGMLRSCKKCGARLPKHRRMLCTPCFKNDNESFYEEEFIVHLPEH